MQFARDSFYVALSERLGRVNPLRTICVNEITRPAIIVIENELMTAAPPPECAFMITWNTAQACKDFVTAPTSLIGLDCSISYGTSGSSEDAVDRGRTITTLDSELFQICAPPFTEKCNYAQTDRVSLGSNIFWTTPRIESRKTGSGGQGSDAPVKGRSPVFHVANLTVFFYPEVVLHEQ